MRVYLIVPFFIFFLSCAKKQVISVDIEYHELQLDVGNDGDPRMIKWKLQDYNNTVLIWNKDLQNNIYCYNLIDSSKNKSINIPSQGPGSAYFSGFFIGEEAIILKSVYGVYKYDFQGNQLTKLLFNSIDTLDISEKFINLRSESNFWFDPNNFDIQTGKIFFYYYNMAKTFNEDPIIASIETNTGEITIFETPTPVDIASSALINKSLTLRNYHYPSISVAGDYLICSYGGYNEFYSVKISDLNNSQSPDWRQVNIKSDFKTHKFRPILSSDIKASTAVMEQNTYFGPVKWDPYRKLYYRISYLPTEPIDDNVKAKPVLLVMDSNFTKLTEIKLDTDLRLQSWQVGKEGIYTLLPSENENIVKFKIIEVSIN